MDAVEQALKKLKQLDGEVTSEIIKDLISDHASKRQEMIERYERYKASKHGTPILQRTFEDKKKINNKLNNDYFSDIIDTKVGYFSGEPVSYQIDKNKFADSEGSTGQQYDTAMDVLRNFKQRNNIPDLDAETSKMAAICGYGARLCYIDKDGYERVMNVDPWECVFITDMSINEPQYSMRYYKVAINQGDKQSERWRVEWYDDNSVKYFIQDSTGNYQPDQEEPERPHMFEEVPLMGFPNNEEHQGDGDKVLELIDGVDRTLSDVNSEIEQFRLAYMYFKGMDISPYTDEQGNTVDPLERAKKTGGFEIPEDGDIGFITKMLEDSIIENHLNRLDNNIYKFSKTPNFLDEAFAGSQSGEARKFKMLPFENKCIVTERKFSAALTQMFKVITSAWKKKGINIDYLDIYFEFTRNFPLDLLHEAEATEKLKGQISEKRRLSLLSFIEDPEQELEAMQEEMEGMIDLDNEPVEDEEAEDEEE